MLNYDDVQRLRENGQTNRQILELMAPMVPSAGQLLEQVDADTKTPKWQIETRLGEMLDKGVPKDAPSGMAYIAAVNLNKAEEKFNISNQSFEQKINPKPSLLGKIGGAIGTAYQYAQAPIQSVVGGIEHAVNGAYKGLTGKDTSLVSDAPYQNVRDNLQKTGEIAPAVLGTAGSAVGPVGTAVGTGAGQGVKQLIDASLGNNQMSPVQQVMEPIKQGAYAGTVDMAFGVLGKGVQKALEYVGDNMPARLINSLIKPANGEFKFGKNPGQAIVNEGIIATNADDLFAKVAAKADEIGQGIEQSITQRSLIKPTQIDVTSAITEPIDDTIKALKKLPKTNAATIDALNNLKDDLVTNFGGVHTELGAWQAKREIQSLINWKSDAALSNDINQALWQSFSNLGSKLNAAVPGLEKLNQRYAELIAAKTSIARRVMNAQRSNMLGLQTISSGLVGAATGGIGGAGLGVAASKLAGTTPAKTIAAQGLKALSVAGKSLLSSLESLAPAERFAIIQMLTNGNQDNTTTPQQ